MFKFNVNANLSCWPRVYGSERKIEVKKTQIITQKNTRNSKAKCANTWSKKANIIGWIRTAPEHAFLMAMNLNLKYMNIAK